jgi:ubiquinone/menaquinone biosynthesis C-methylase UbiE
MKMETNHYIESIAPSAAIYNRLVLYIYDFYVLGFSNSMVWKCPSSLIKEFYNEHLSHNHLDIGVGTGYFLDKCVFPEPQPKIKLMDLNPNCLQIAAKRIERYKPSFQVADILKPLPLTHEHFDSVGLNYLLHCLPGNLLRKSDVVFKHIKPYLNPGATVFGTTILGQNPTNFLAKRLLKIYNKKGIMGNAHDTREDLEKALSNHFDSHTIWEVGSVAFFVAK